MGSQHLQVIGNSSSWQTRPFKWLQTLKLRNYSVDCQCQRPSAVSYDCVRTGIPRETSHRRQRGSWQSLTSMHACVQVLLAIYFFLAGCVVSQSRMLWVMPAASAVFACILACVSAASTLLSSSYRCALLLDGSPPSRIPSHTYACSPCACVCTANTV